MRHHDQPVDLLVAGIGEREHGPVGACLTRPHLDPAHDAVAAGRGRDLDAVGIGLLPLDRIGQIDGRDVDRHIDRFDGARRSSK